MEDNQSLLDLQVDDQTAVQLHETSKWAKFLAISVLSALGLFTLILIGVWGGLDAFFREIDTYDQNSMQMLKVVIGITMIFVIAIVVILMTFLIKGANAIRRAMVQKDPVLFNTGLAHIRNYFAMTGVIALLGLVLKLIGFFF
ncbi:MAG: hypothetical protein J7527_18210 [Chitinophagaceae bacterium]|nr:hypothetical protein [Chitinophagaceae bacterium]